MWISHEESKKKESLHREESGRVFFGGRHTDSVPKEIHADSVMTKRLLATLAAIRDEKDDRLLSHSEPKIDGEGLTSSKESGNKVENSSDARVIDWEKKYYGFFDSEKMYDCRLREFANIEKLEVAEPIQLQEARAQSLERLSTESGWMM